MKKKPFKYCFLSPRTSRCKVQQHNAEREKRWWKKKEKKQEPLCQPRTKQYCHKTLCRGKCLPTVKQRGSIDAHRSSFHRHNQNSNNYNNCNGLVTLIMSITITINDTLSSVTLLTLVFHLNRINHAVKEEGNKSIWYLVKCSGARVSKWIVLSSVQYR